MLGPQPCQGIACEGAGGTGPSSTRDCASNCVPGPGSCGFTGLTSEVYGFVGE